MNLTDTGPLLTGPVLTGPVPASPPATRLARPRWRDARLLLGVLLVLVSVVAGSRLLAGADRTVPVWAVSRDLPAGIRLTEDDVELRQVRLGVAGPNYLSAVRDPVGRVLAGPVSAGDLLAASALTLQPDGQAGLREVTVPVSAFHYPPGLSRGAIVDVYVTPGSAGGSDGGVGATTSLTSGASSDPGPRLLASAVIVVGVDGVGSGLGGLGSAPSPSGTVGVVLDLRGDQVLDLVAGIRSGPVDLVLVPAR
jgi:hypothetical protein